MDELELIIAYADITAVHHQLGEWGRKSDNGIFPTLEKRLIEANTIFRALEKELRISKQINSELRLTTSKQERELEELKKENQELKEYL